MSELQLIYKFLGDYANTGVINADGTLYAVSACKDDDMDKELLWFNGLTISDAIRKFYEAIEEKENVSK